jgi:hypothetical protein
VAELEQESLSRDIPSPVEIAKSEVYAALGRVAAEAGFSDDHSRMMWLYCTVMAPVEKLANLADRNGGPK